MRQVIGKPSHTNKDKFGEEGSKAFTAVTKEVTEILLTEGWGVARINKADEEVREIKPFAPNGNIHDNNEGISDDAHYYLRKHTQFALKMAFDYMKVDLNDLNVEENKDEGNIGTPGRVAKMWLGATPSDTTELLSGRWNKPPRMASFDTDSTNLAPVFVTTTLRGVCSHHVIGFNDNPSNAESLAVVGYIPKDGVKGGISKISRIVNFASRRMWLQEDLTDYIGKLVAEKFQTDHVYVALLSINHGCSWTRGANDDAAHTTTYYKTGNFNDNIDLIPEKFR